MVLCSSSTLTLERFKQKMQEVFSILAAGSFVITRTVTSLKVWLLSDLSLVREFKVAGGGDITSPASDGTHLVGLVGTKLYQWALSTGELLATIDIGSHAHFLTADFSRQIACAAWMNTVSLVDLASRQVMKRVDIVGVVSIAMNLPGRQLLASSVTRTLFTLQMPRPCGSRRAQTDAAVPADAAQLLQVE